MMLNTGRTKPFASYDRQIEILASRGLKIPDINRAKDILSQVNYYRFSAYSLTLRKDDHFYDDVTFDNIYDLYCFDEHFRNIIFRYSCIVEVAFRSYVSYVHTEKYGALGYMQSRYFMDPLRQANMLIDLDEQVDRSDDLFVNHHKNDLNSVFPLWVVLEVSTFGTLSKFYKNMIEADREYLAVHYTGFHRRYVENWLQCCSYCRNVAAHGGRFYNRQLMACPVLLNKKRFPGIAPTSIYAFVIAIYNLLPSAEAKESFIADIENAINDHPFVSLKYLGFPKDWSDLLRKKRNK